jgi:NAD(P)-dependent dehydrogenase (short-subunit alcohol dehydrogenase family)
MGVSAHYPSLAERCVFITGGATGIGAALVEAFTRQSARVAFVDVDEQAGHDLVNGLSGEGFNPPWFRSVDVTRVEDLQQAIGDAADELGALDTLVNNAANDQRHSPEDVTPESWRQCMAINLDAAFFASQAAAAVMAPNKRGSIINFGSINALLGPSNMPGYVAAKAGIMGLTKSLAKDYGKHNLRVNAILPGWVATERQLKTWLTPEEEHKWMQQVALQSRLMPQDVANLALFLAADDSNMISGQNFVIDGGRT